MYLAFITSKTLRFSIIEFSFLHQSLVTSVLTNCCSVCGGPAIYMPTHNCSKMMVFACKLRLKLPSVSKANTENELSTFLKRIYLSFFRSDRKKGESGKVLTAAYFATSHLVFDLSIQNYYFLLHMQLSKKSTLTIALTDKYLLKIENLGTTSKRNIEIQAKITQLTKTKPC